MRVRPAHTIVAAFAGLALAVSAAHGFTVENKDSASGVVPQFDLGEQAKQFRKEGSDAAAVAGRSSVPFAGGTLEFGAGQGTTSNFGSTFGPAYGGMGSNAARQDFERVLRPENLR